MSNQQFQSLPEAEYQLLARTTESMPDDSMRERLLDCLPQLVVNLLDAEEIGDSVLDLFKKKIFYGRPLESVNFHTLSSSGNSRHFTGIDTEKASMWFTDDNIRILHALIGLQTEVSELISQFVDALISDQPLDLVNLFEEAGDTKWYLDALCHALGTNIELVGIANIKKLNIDRYTEGKFDPDKERNRDVITERENLENSFDEATKNKKD